jgi:hypothetical protein
MYRHTHLRSLAVAAVVAASLGAAAPAFAQAPEYQWSIEAGLGWDNSISGNINSGAVGTLNGQTTVIVRNKYEDVYGTGLHARFGAGYMIDALTELRILVSIQSLDADLVTMGDIGVSRLYAQYDDYQAFSLDVGLRRYSEELATDIRAYGEATIGLAVIERTNVLLVAPGLNLAQEATDFYDGTAAFAMAGHAGVLWQMTGTFGFFGQMGVRYLTGMSEVDDLAGTGLETINDKSARWTVPVVFGVRARF